MTYIYDELNTNQIANTLLKDSYAAWSYNGAYALAEWLEQLAEDTGEPQNLDIVALRCEFSEYKNLNEFNQCYNSANPFDTWEQVRENTTVIEFGGGAIVGEF